MRIAIMGAGMSGLSCAITLEKHGIEPVIFEKRNCVGDRFVNGEATFSILNRPIDDGIKYIYENYDIKLTPVSRVEELTMHSKNEVGNISGGIGYTNIRGRHEESYENQLGRQVRSKINFNSKYEYEDLCKEFDCVILSPGDGEYAAKLGNYKCDLTCTIKGATIEGEFIKSNPHVWFNYDIVPKGYVFLIPYSDKEANLSMAYPDYPENIKLDIVSMWKRAFEMVSMNLGQSFRVTDRFEITRYMMGICNKPRLDNTYFTGNCFGSISPGLGFGQITSVLSGVYAAYDIIGIGKYEELVKPLFENYEHSLVLRRFLESLSNNELDMIIKNLDNGLASGIIDRLNSLESDTKLLERFTPLMRIWNKFRNT